MKSKTCKLPSKSSSVESKKNSKTLRESLYYNNLKDRVRLYHGDSIELLKCIPDESIDMIFADPPYFGNQSGLKINRNDGHSKNFNTCKASWAYSKDLSYQFDFHLSWLLQAKRILRKGSTIWITGTYHSIGVVNVVLQDLGFKILNDIVLYKRNAPPNFKGSCFRAMTETMLWAKKDPSGKTKFNYWDMKKINGGVQMNNLWGYTAKKNPFIHPATKQPIILEYVILSSSNEGDLILDPFSGSGTTGYVSKSLNRKCILIEKELKYCRLIKERLQGKYGKYTRETGVKE